MEDAPAFEPIVPRAQLAREISRAIARFNNAHAGRVTQPAYLHSLLAEVCRQPGCVPLETVVLCEEFTPGIDASRRQFEAWIAVQLMKQLSPLLELLQQLDDEGSEQLLESLKRQVPR